jgi:hypothetical protein
MPRRHNPPPPPPLTLLTTAYQRWEGGHTAAGLLLGDGIKNEVSPLRPTPCFSDWHLPKFGYEKLR